MLHVKAIEKKCIDLGRRGEDSARVIEFDITGWAELYGQGSARLIAKRDHDLYTYDAVITQDNTTVLWVIKPVDNDQPGYGYCELVYITDGVVAKSILYQTFTDVSLSDPVFTPDTPVTLVSLDNKIGDTEDLKTEEKSNLVSALNSFYEKVINSLHPNRALELVTEVGLVSPMTDESGNILTDEKGNLFIFEEV